MCANSQGDACNRCVTADRGGGGKRKQLTASFSSCQSMCVPEGSIQVALQWTKQALLQRRATREGCMSSHLVAG